MYRANKESMSIHLFCLTGIPAKAKSQIYCMYGVIMYCYRPSPSLSCIAVNVRTGSGARNGGQDVEEDGDDKRSSKVVYLEVSSFSQL